MNIDLKGSSEYMICIMNLAVFLALFGTSRGKPLERSSWNGLAWITTAMGQIFLSYTIVVFFRTQALSMNF